MFRNTLRYVLGIAFVAGLANVPVAMAGAAGTASVMHSGIITSIEPDKRILTLQEMGPWTGPDTKPVSVSITLQPTTTIELVQRSPVVNDGDWPGGYVDSPLKAADLRAGEFANVSTVRDGTHLVAVSVGVVKPSND